MKTRADPELAPTEELRLREPKKMPNVATPKNILFVMVETIWILLRTIPGERSWRNHPDYS